MRLVSLLGLAFLAAACGGASEALQTGPTTTSEAPGWTTFEDPEARLTVSHPPDWLPAPERLMPGLSDPRELVALSTFDARRGGENCAHMPENAIEDMGPTDALVVVEERLAEVEGGLPSDYPPRPSHFGASDGGYPSEAVDCLDRRKEFFDRLIPFSDAGRSFYAYVAFGPETPSAVRTEAWAILDRLEIAPRSGT